ncbi:MAG: helix-turn-helix domain-containing protein [Thermoguttaceae bacterium]|nr:helix-turn-helix domain-containing protein [Thermoguttaceae bacterium]
MAQNYLAVEDVASLLNITNAEVIAATTQGHLRGFKDGASWKFRKEDVDKYANDLKNAVSDAEDDFGYGEDYDLEGGSEIAGSSDINNTLDTDVSFSGEESGLALSQYSDDDGGLVLGEDTSEGPSSSGLMGSGLGLAEQSGISLMSATDSGISLDDEETGEVLELGEDNLAMGSSLLSGSLAASLSVANDDFTLTTDDEGEDEDSGSQVIMIDDNDDLGDSSLPAPDEFGDGLGEGEGDGFGDGAVAAGGEPIIQTVEKIVREDRPEKPYSIWEILGLLFCFAFLTVTLLFTVDLVRNIWSWDKTPYSSALMDWAIQTFIEK